MKYTDLIGNHRASLVSVWGPPHTFHFRFHAIWDSRRSDFSFIWGFSPCLGFTPIWFQFIWGFSPCLGFTPICFQQTSVVWGYSFQIQSLNFYPLNLFSISLSPLVFLYISSYFCFPNLTNIQQELLYVHPLLPNAGSLVFEIGLLLLASVSRLLHGCRLPCCQLPARFLRQINKKKFTAFSFFSPFRNSLLYIIIICATILLVSKEKYVYFYLLHMSFPSSLRFEIEGYS